MSTSSSRSTAALKPGFLRPAHSLLLAACVLMQDALTMADEITTTQREADDNTYYEYVIDSPVRHMPLRSLLLLAATTRYLHPSGFHFLSRWNAHWLQGDTLHCQHCNKAGQDFCHVHRCSCCGTALHAYPVSC